MTHTQLGTLGEQYATHHLQQNGYHLLANNWRYKRLELDIVARQGKELVFVEVKSRTKGRPEDAVTYRKRQLLATAASAYLYAHPHDGEIRFDVVSVNFAKDQSYKLQHYQNAFFPGTFTC